MKVVKQLLNINSNFGAAMIRTSTSSSELIQHSNNTRRQCQNVWDDQLKHSGRDLCSQKREPSRVRRFSWRSYSTERDKVNQLNSCCMIDVFKDRQK